MPPQGDGMEINMETHERERVIMAEIEKTGFASVEEISAKLYVSPSSIRRDLTRLEQKKLIKRVYGGAVLMESVNNNTPYEVRKARNVEQKKKAAQYAAVLLKDSISVILDGSSTSMHMLAHIKNYRNIKVFTNNIYTFIAAAEMGINACCLGGNPSADASSLSGTLAEEAVEKLYPDILFFSAKAVSDDGDITDSLDGETRLRRIMIKNAKTKVLICDKGKFGKRSLYKICNISDIDYIFSEDGELKADKK